MLVPEAGDEPASYETRPVGEHFALARKPNGDCVYLGDKGCTIYDRRPAICRTYDCAGQFLSMTRNERRQGVRLGHLDKAILRKGREIALTRSP